MNWISWIVIGAVGLVAAVFSVSNREIVELILWPTPFVVNLPLYILLLGPFVIGVFIGWVWSWLVSGKSRARARRAEFSAKVKQRDMDVLQQKLKIAETAKQDAEEKVESVRLESDNAAKALAGPVEEKKTIHA